MHPDSPAPSFPGRRPTRALGACLAGILAILSSGKPAIADVMIYASTDIPRMIPDNNSTGITSTLFVPDSVVVTDLDLILNQLLHASVSDLRIELTSPHGTTAVVVKAAPEGGILSGLGTRGNFIGTTFDDQAPTNLRDAVFDNHTGTYNINHASVGNSPLAIFNGEDAKGTWTLRVSDRARLDTGELDAWSLRLSFSPVPEPSSLILLALGLAGAGAFARARRRG
ncbi:MAG: proprotein convertase P-domain-containing protein [Isosphaeraceae bacterium]